MSAAARRQSLFGRFTRHRPALLGAVAVVLLCLAALFAPALAPHDPVELEDIPRQDPATGEYRADR